MPTVAEVMKAWVPPNDDGTPTEAVAREQAERMRKQIADFVQVVVDSIERHQDI